MYAGPTGIPSPKTSGFSAQRLTAAGPVSPLFVRLLGSHILQYEFKEMADCALLDLV